MSQLFLNFKSSTILDEVIKKGRRLGFSPMRNQHEVYALGKFMGQSEKVTIHIKKAGYFLLFIEYWEMEGERPQ